MGRWLRLVVGVTTVVVITYRVGTNALAAAFWGQLILNIVAALAIYTAVHDRLGKRILSALNPWVGTGIILGPTLAVLAFDLGPPALQDGLSLYLGVSLLFSFVLGYGGCEARSIPTLLRGKRYIVYCPYNAVDIVEKAVIERQAKS